MQREHRSIRSFFSPSTKKPPSGEPQPTSPRGDQPRPATADPPTASTTGAPSGRRQDENELAVARAKAALVSREVPLPLARGVGVRALTPLP